MKKSLILLGLLGLQQAFAQTGNVGINTDNPSATLNVKSKTGTTNSTKNLELENANGTKLVTILDDGKVGIGTQTPQYNLESRGTVAFPNLTTVESPYLAVGVNTTTGKLGTYPPNKVLYRVTDEERKGQILSSKATPVESPINSGNAQSLVNTINATFGKDDTREYIEFTEDGTYRIELLTYAVFQNTGNEQAGSTTQARTVHILLNKKEVNGTSWATIDNQRILNMYFLNNSAEITRPFIYMDNFKAGDKISFQMTSQHQLNLNGGWAKPGVNKYSVQVIITKI